MYDAVRMISVPSLPLIGAVMSRSQHRDSPCFHVASRNVDAPSLLSLLWLSPLIFSSGCKFWYLKGKERGKWGGSSQSSYSFGTTASII